MYAELVFAVEAFKNSITVSRPQIESPFDLYAEGLNGVKKIQVKSTNLKYKSHRLRVNRYRFSIRKGAAKDYYSRSDLDLYALYVIPIDKWWIIPFETLLNKGSIIINIDNDIYNEFYNNFGII